MLFIELVVLILITRDSNKNKPVVVSVASSMFSFVFQSLISSMHGDEDVIAPSDAEVIPPSDVESDAEEVESDGVDNSQQENQVYITGFSVFDSRAI